MTSLLSVFLGLTLSPESKLAIVTSQGEMGGVRVSVGCLSCLHQHLDLNVDFCV